MPSVILRNKAQHEVVTFLEKIKNSRKPALQVGL